MRTRFIHLKNKSALLTHIAGGKGAGLARLVQNGFTIPESYVLTTKLWHKHFSVFFSPILRSKKKASLNDLEKVKKTILEAEIPAALVKDITAVSRKLSGPLAIRSSMIGEDSEYLSFAGQLDSVLHVSGIEQIGEAIKKCTASLCSRRVLSYVEAQNIDVKKGSMRMAIIIQQMVTSSAAGIAFSADPVNGLRRVIIEAASGEGSEVVGGKVVPDRYVVDARENIVSFRPARASAPALTETQILELAREVRRIAALFQSPQDVEWTHDGTQFIFLQSRPITTLHGKHIYSNRLVADMSPGLVVPLLWSTKSISFTKHVLGRIFREILGPVEFSYSRLTRRFHSRIYADMTLFGTLLRRAGLPENFFEMLVVEEKAARQRPKMNMRLMGIILFRLLPFVWRNGRAASGIRAFLESHNVYLDAYRNMDWRNVHVKDQFSGFVRLLKKHRHSQWMIFIAAMNMALRKKMLDKIARTCTPSVRANDLLYGNRGIQATEPNDMIDRMADLVDARNMNLFFDKKDVDIRTSLCRESWGESLLDMFDSFMEQFGFLSANGTDFTCQPWIEHPEMVWTAIGNAANDSNRQVRARVNANRQESIRKVRRQMSRITGVVFDHLIASTSEYIAFRDKLSLILSEDAYQMRRILMSIGEFFTTTGYLKKWDDIFYLFFNELKEVVENGRWDKSLHSVIRKRKREFKRDQNMEIDDTICGDCPASSSFTPQDGEECLIGISGSSGLKKGYAKIYHNPDDDTKNLKEDDVLVVPFTDIGWTPVFPCIGAIVAETGGQLSHTSIIAREYGLPAVVSVKNATRIIIEGQPVTVDGTNGRVYLKHLNDEEVA
ncbi:MAG: PEP/pyruvate-binding domain-containing protein [candidate division KSB1 bacterium]|jgi:pyruvate,water dikinase|nr:PEP/pyruvate-binding domain-containing protein [candidate division KSB1 bacterium]